MNQMYFLVKDEEELRDKVWKNFSEKLAGGAALRIQELEVNGSNKRLFKVWTEWPAASYITYDNITTTTTPMPQWRNNIIPC